MEVDQTIRGEIEVSPFTHGSRPVDVAILYSLGQKDRAQHIARKLHPMYGTIEWELMENTNWNDDEIQEFVGSWSDDSDTEAEDWMVEDESIFDKLSPLRMWYKFR